MVLFDLGGVLIDFGGVDAMRELAGIDAGRRGVAPLARLRRVRAFERGHCSPEEFGEGVVADWGLADRRPGLPRRVLGLAGRAAPGRPSWSTTSPQVARIGRLSNTNPVHWVHWERWPFVEQLEFRLLSFELAT